MRLFSAMSAGVPICASAGRFTEIVLVDGQYEAGESPWEISHFAAPYVNFGGCFGE